MKLKAKVAYEVGHGLIVRACAIARGNSKMRFNFSQFVIRMQQVEVFCLSELCCVLFVIVLWLC